jgi:TonB family protein
MSVSQVVIKHRQEESQHLRTLLICSLTGSFLLHIGILVSGILDLLKSATEQEIAPKPIEITFIEVPQKKPEPITKKIIPTPPEKLSKPTRKTIQNTSPIPLSSPVEKIEQKTHVVKPSRNISNFTKPNISTFKTPISQIPKIKTRSFSTPEPVKEIIPQPTSEPTPKVTPRSFSIPEPIPEPTPKITPRSFSTPEPTPEPIPEPTPKITPRSFSTPEPAKEIIPQPTPVNNTNFDKLRDSLSQNSSNSSDNIRNARTLIDGNSNDNPYQINNNDVPASPGLPDNNSGNNSHQRTLRTTFTGDSNENKTAMNPQTSNSGDGRASCVQCGTSYPSWARRRGVEGRIVVTVDTDSAGNVINLELVSSSGSGRLDEEHLNMVKRWKLKPSENGRTGVTIATEYVLK